MLLLLTLFAFVADGNEIVWRYRVPAGHPDGSPAVDDINGDGSPDIVLTTTVGSVIALDGQGFMLWRWDSGQAFSVGPTLADVMGDPLPEVLAVGNQGEIACLDGSSGTPLWRADELGKLDWGMSAIAVADVDGDGKAEIIAPDSAGTLLCLNGDGTCAWTMHEPGAWASCPAVGDVDGDGHCEVMMGSGDSPLVCLDHKGREQWRLPPEGAAWTSPVIWDLDGDGKPEVLTGIGAGLAAVSAHGKVLWRHPMSRDIDAAISVADADRNGEPEVYAVDLNGELACVSSRGELLWKGHVEERARRSPAIADVDGDGEIEILVGGYSGALHVFEASGELQERIPLGEATNATPAIVDMLGNGRLQVVCAVTSGELLVFQWPSGDEAAPAVLWPEYRYNRARTAARSSEESETTVSLAEIDYGPCYVGMNTFVARVNNPNHDSLEVSLGVSKEGGHAALASVDSSEEVTECRLPYNIIGRRPIRLRFTCVVRRDGDIVLERSHNDYVVPFVRELAEAERALTALTEAHPQLPDAHGLEERIHVLRAGLPQLRDQTHIVSGLSSEEHRALCAELAELRAECARWTGIVDLATSPEATRGVALSAANPWAPFGGMDEAVEGRAGSPDLLVEAFQGEHEAAALNIFNANGRPMTLRVVLDSLSKEGVEQDVSASDVLEVREVVEVPSGKLWIADALPALNQSGTIQVPAWGARQLWITANTSHLGPGDWSSRVRLRALDAEPLEVAAPLTLRVWNARLPEKQTLRHCNWGRPASFGAYADAALADMIAHGTNVFVDVPCPEAHFNEQGELVGDIDFSAHDAAVKLRGPDALFLYHAWPIKGPAEPFTLVWEKAAVAWLRAWVKHLHAMGLAYEDFALYPIDEPGLRDGLVDAFIAYAKVADKADPKIRMYTDPVGRANMGDLERMAPYVDIWCPERRGFFMGMGEDKLAFMLSTGKPVWMYACEGSYKLQCPLGYFRGQAWQAWRHGLSGIGWWNWCATADTWAPDAGYTTVYKGDGVIPSKRWEAIRDGIEDYGMLTVLNEATEAASEAKRHAEAVQASRRLLAEDAAVIADFCAGDEYATLPGIGGLRGVRPVSDLRWEAIQEVRREMAALLEVLTAEGG